MLDPVVEYNAHAQWAEYMPQAIQLDGHWKLRNILKWIP